jgi:hypothetical protein
VDAGREESYLNAGDIFLIRVDNYWNIVSDYWNTVDDYQGLSGWIAVLQGKYDAAD